MSDSFQLNHPWLVAVWPGMGHVALNAGVYLLAKLGMTEIATLDAGDLFEVDAVEVKGGMIHPARRPRSRFFAWTDPKQKHDLLVFVGEAQPPAGKFSFCRRIVDFGRELGVERVFTFAAMATQMHPAHTSRVFAAATDRTNLDELKRLELDVLEDGHIGGLNGVLLGAAAAAGLNGACLLGEMPHIFAQVPFPKASLAILDAFAVLAGIDLDLTELAEQARVVEERLGEILSQVEGKTGEGESEGFEGAMDEGRDEESEGGAEYHRAGEEGEEAETPARTAQGPHHDTIEALFGAVAKDRSKAFELKQELDRLGLFREYEDRFLDLFQKPE